MLVLNELMFKLASHRPFLNMWLVLIQVWRFCLPLLLATCQIYVAWVSGDRELQFSRVMLVCWYLVRDGMLSVCFLSVWLKKIASWTFCLAGNSSGYFLQEISFWIVRGQYDLRCANHLHCTLIYSLQAMRNSYHIISVKRVIHLTG